MFQGDVLPRPIASLQSPAPAAFHPKPDRPSRINKVQSPSVRSGGGRRYRMCPAASGGPSRDLGSGDRALQGAWPQRCRTGQLLGPAEHTSAAPHRPASRPSAQRRSGSPVSAALASASSTAPRLTGSRSTGFSPWKLCSMYELRGGPPWSRSASSVGGGGGWGGRKDNV